MSTRRWPAWQALRTRVSMSATGSVTLIWPSVLLPTGFAHAGDLPAQREFAETNAAQLELAQQGAGGVVATGARDDGDIHPVDLLDLVVVDLGEDHLFLDADRVVAPAVEAVRRQPAEVAHARHRDGDEPIEKLVHPRAPQRYGAADRHALPEIEVRDRLLGARHDRVLAGDRGELGRRRLQALGVLGRIPHPDVEHDLHELGNFVRVAEPELLGELRPHALLVVLEQPGPRCRLGRRALRLRGPLLPLRPLLALLVLLLLLVLLGRFRRPLRAGLPRGGS